MPEEGEPLWVGRGAHARDPRPVLRGGRASGAAPRGPGRVCGHVGARPAQPAGVSPPRPDRL